jgi:hypothetical protein
MSSLFAIAWQTVRAQARRRVLRASAVASLLPMCSSPLIARLTIGNYDRTILDIGLSTLEIVGVVLAIAVGTSASGSGTGLDVAPPTITQPSSRRTRLLGGYLGFLALWSATASVMLALLGVLLRIDGFALSRATLCATLLLCVQGAVIAAIALLASAVTTRALAVLLSVSAFLVGHVGDGIAPLATRAAGVPLATLAITIRHVIPNLELFNLKAQAASRLEVPLAFAVDASLYGACYASAVLALACLAPGRRATNVPSGV